MTQFLCHRQRSMLNWTMIDGFGESYCTVSILYFTKFAQFFSEISQNTLSYFTEFHLAPPLHHLIKINVRTQCKLCNRNN